MREIRHYSRVPLSRTAFVASLIEAAPEVQPVVDENLRDQDGQLLLHLLVADVRRFSIATFESGDEDLSHRLLSAIDTGLREGDEEVENAIAVSFVEDTGWWEPAMQPFIASWPHGLQGEVTRQRSSRS